MDTQKYNALDIFCGAGGMSRGFKCAGFNIKYAIDKDRQAIKTFKHNHPNTIVFEEDVRCIDYSSLDEIDIIIGGFPCTAFSNANRNRREDHPDRFLFKEYLRAINEIRPKIFIMENVNGILSEDDNHNSVIKEIEKYVATIGYVVKYWPINMAYWGLPQKRERIIVVGSRVGEINIDSFDECNNLGLVSVFEAIGDLAYIEPLSIKSNEKYLSYSIDPQSKYQRERRKKCNNVYNHIKVSHGEKFIQKISYVPQGGNWRNMPSKFVSKNMSRHYNAYRRLEYNNQSITIVNVRKCCVLHPEKNRVLTPREAARLQGFDDDFLFIGTEDSIYQQIANAVSPLVAQKIASDIIQFMNKM